MHGRLDRAFFRRDVLEVAPELLGKRLVMADADGSKSIYIITETEAYRGVDDLACHASKGRTRRTEVMFGDGGHVYMYLIYGMYWMMNVVTSMEGTPQAVLIRGLSEVSGPGRVTRLIGVDKSFNGEDLVTSGRIGIEESENLPSYTSAPRVGIDYAGEPWKSKPWRFLMNL
ncbi:MAG: DNA-3-methyladenine glycosylase [Bacteroidetes bacterium]|nr:DNA-3-methyladenine glycosylase [Bacteroidota bacterium]